MSMGARIWKPKRTSAHRGCALLPQPQFPNLPAPSPICDCQPRNHLARQQFRQRVWRLNRVHGAFRTGLWCLLCLFWAMNPAAAAKSSASGGGDYVVRSDRWSEADERDYSQWIQAIGRSGCNTTDSCLKGSGNPFRDSDPPGAHFYSDCAQLPYVLRAYFAWKRGLPFSYESGISPRGATSDIRYSQTGNQVTGRTDVLTGSTDGYKLLHTLQAAISTASFRIHPALERPKESDFYSPAIRIN